ncbi:MAG: type II toxin-antitoxin system PemK/MazF family toxin [Armatimonadetes bacterium]|nr:type II toxin-antitoxin system PemK/MazF family toxin [Armatimonadota bacterium]
MARYVKGDVISVNFPFSSDTQFKFRPAVVLASWPYLDSRDYLVCMISTQDDEDPFQIEVHREDTFGGSFQQRCFIRPAYTFAASERKINRKVCALRPEKLDAILRVLHELLDT